MANSDNNEDTQCQQDQQQQQQQNQQQQQQQPQSPPYTIPGILHFLQYEWQRFESDRQQWEVEKAELSARIALLQGERKAHENLKHDLVRRIKMLEYCLRLERAKFHRLKYGVDPPAYSMQEDPNEDTSQQQQPKSNNEPGIQTTDSKDISTNVAQNSSNIGESVENFSPNNPTNAQWKNGRELLRQYLQEIGYTDTIIDLRSNRVRSLLGIVTSPNENVSQAHNAFENVFNEHIRDHLHEMRPDRYQHQQVQKQQHLKQQENLDSSGQSAIMKDAHDKAHAMRLADRDMKTHSDKKSSNTPPNRIRGGGLQNKIDETKQSMPVDSQTEGATENESSVQQNCNGQRTWPTSSIVADTEASVLATFGFLSNYSQSRTSADPRSSSDTDEDDDASDDAIDDVDSSATVATGYSYHYEKDVSSETQIFGRKQMDFLGSTSGPGSTNETGTSNIDNSNGKAVTSFVDPQQLMSVNALQHQQTPAGGVAKGWRPGPVKSDAVDIGELATLATFTSENIDVNGGSLDSGSSKLNDQRKSWSAKYLLKSHFDCVRALRFHERELILVTASEDETIKLWNLNKTQPTINKSKQAGDPVSLNTPNSASTTAVDLEPVFTYRGHTSAVLSLAIHDFTIYSGAKNGEIIMWYIRPPIDCIDPYEKYDGSLMLGHLKGHTDSVWSLECMNIPSQTLPVLCSASADMTIRIWDVHIDQKSDGNGYLTKPALVVIDVSHLHPPTCLATIPNLNHNTCFDCTDLAVAFEDGHISFYDIAARLAGNDDSNEPKASFFEGESSRVNSIAIHPTLPFMVSAHQDKQIKFWDLSKKCHVYSMVAHLEEVTSVACDSQGVYLLSAAHDCSVRIWNFNDKVCVQEMSPHRKKFDEAIFGVTFHPSLPHFATGGADGLAKVYVCWPTDQ